MKTGTLYTFKIVNGDEIIARVKQVHDDYIEVDNSLTVVLTASGTQLVQSLFTSNPRESIMLNKSSIAMYVETRPEIENSYTEATTGIKTVSKQIITG